MLVYNQRWRKRRTSFKPSNPIDTSQYEVAEIPDDTTARAFVEEHHYGNSYPSARFRFGIFTKAGELAGVAVFSHPSQNKVLTNVFNAPANAAAELGRFVLLDSVPGNGETWFLARCFEQLRQRLIGIVSFSDPVPRTALNGEVAFRGHIGAIYQGHNAIPFGRSEGRILKIFPDGTSLHHRTETKIKARAKGWRAAVELLVGWGAKPPGGPRSDLGRWLARELPCITRRLKHPGNHRYVWGFDRPERKRLRRIADEKEFVYPKELDISVLVQGQQVVRS